LLSMLRHSTINLNQVLAIICLKKKIAFIKNMSFSFLEKGL
jgi:hypothetical protein